MKFCTRRCLGLVFVFVAFTTIVAGAPSCNPAVGKCFADHAAVIDTFKDVTVSECCTHCTNACRAWTHWLDNGVPMCNIFNELPAASNPIVNCTSGYNLQGRPNFVFVFPDTLRAESFSSYGNKLNVTPNLDAFAASGTRFEQAHVMHTQCSPSRCTMITGRYMHIDGHRTQTHLVQDYEANYFRYLKESGYHIEWHGKNDMLSANAFNLSVSNWSQDIGYQSGTNAFKYGEPGYFSFLNSGSTVPGNDTSNKDWVAMQKAMAFLASDPPEPFVIFIPSRGAHPPYGAPLEWHNKFPVDDVRAAVQLRQPNIPTKPNYVKFESGIPHYRNLTTLDDSVFYKIQSVYLGMIAYTDWLFGQLLAAVDNSPFAENTAIFFSSDHGDFGGDYHLVEKWPGSMEDILTRVPLIARVPHGKKGFVSKAPVQTADILETMLDLAGINATHARFAQSLVPQIMNGTEGDLSRTVYSEGGFFFENAQMIEADECLSGGPEAIYYPRGLEESQPNGSPKAIMLRNLTTKLVYRPTGISELYDLTKDPKEINNVYTDNSYVTLRNELTMQLLEWLTLTSDVTPLIVDPRGAPKNPYEIQCSTEYTSTQESRLRKKWMNYLQINGVIQGN